MSLGALRLGYWGSRFARCLDILEDQGQITALMEVAYAHGQAFLGIGAVEYVLRRAGGKTQANCATAASKSMRLAMMVIRIV